MILMQLLQRPDHFTECFKRFVLLQVGRSTSAVNGGPGEPLQIVAFGRRRVETWFTMVK